MNGDVDEALWETLRAGSAAGEMRQLAWGHWQH
jgi:hypothetical protein